MAYRGPIFTMHARTTSRRRRVLRGPRKLAVTASNRLLSRPPKISAAVTPPQISRHAAAAAARPAEPRRPSCPSHKRRSSSSSSSSSSNDSAFDVLADEALLDDPMEERIEAAIMAQLFRGADPEAYRQAVAQQEALRARRVALQREVAESRAQTRRLRAYTDLLNTDVSGYSEAEVEEYRRELQRRSKECFGK